MTQTSDARENRLAKEKSPYLLQHSHNPVDWYPWCDEAFERAGREDRPVFLSIGYSTCHWCHVMERESFENDEIAVLINEAFIPVKVDREERPDIDAVYMEICHLMTGGGGWPLTIIMTPGKKPFFAATYIPSENRFGHAGLRELIPAISAAWRERRFEIDEATRQIVRALDDLASSRSGPAGTHGAAVPGEAAADLASVYDARHGGFARVPKFPIPHNLSFLLARHARTGERTALSMALDTLSAIRRGGIYDQAGFGMHRYSVDERWLVPHFEKMLYDQALVITAFADAWKMSGDAFFLGAARDTVEYAMRDLRSPEGAFYSAEDADSEGEEGRFYLWTAAEFESILAPEECDAAAEAWTVRPGGNFVEQMADGPDGRNILHRRSSDAETARRLGMDEKAFSALLESARKKILAARSERVRPHLDDKVLADWNGLMISALARYYMASGDGSALEGAVTAARFVIDKMRDGAGRLLHRYRDGEAAIRGMLDDHAFMMRGLIDLYLVTFDGRYLSNAMSLNDDCSRLFGSAAGGYFMTPDDGEELLIRQRTADDGACPSGNSVMAENLTRLWLITGEDRFREGAAAIFSAFAETVSRAPSSHCLMLQALDMFEGPWCRVEIDAGQSAAHVTPTGPALELVRAAWSAPNPFAVVVMRNAAHRAGNAKDETHRAGNESTKAPNTEGSSGHAPRAFVCVGNTCLPPISDPAELKTAIGRAARKS